MATLLKTTSLYYNDVNLVGKPQLDDSYPSSRTQVPKELWRVFVAPMEAVVGEEFAAEAAKLGLSLTIPRFKDVGYQKAVLSAAVGAQTSNDYISPYVAVGLNDWKRVEELGSRLILIDVANAYLYSVEKFTKELRKQGYQVMVGNVHTKAGCDRFPNSLIRCNIGGGSVCQTSKITGYNRGQITELMECCDESASYSIIADAGIADSGCAAKAFGAGADYVMMGGYFKSADCAKNVIDGTFSYFGGASLKQQLIHYGEKKRHSEGREVTVDKDSVKPLSELVDDLWGGLSSAVTYSGYKTLTDFIGNGVFERKA